MFSKQTLDSPPKLGHYQRQTVSTSPDGTKPTAAAAAIGLNSSRPSMAELRAPPKPKSQNNSRKTSFFGELGNVRITQCSLPARNPCIPTQGIAMLSRKRGILHGHLSRQT